MKENIKKLKLVTILGTRPEIITIRIINNCDNFFEHVLIHTGQNFDYELNKIFLKNCQYENLIILLTLQIKVLVPLIQLEI